ncbi:MAG: UDP-N-acetylmuramoyl-L-alanyl-D-glutamate--2,6-diaminopimelate ligase [Cytophagales bacterium]|nr:UDP-N-acetylmuramoyl-L-alanyl-D-glutamate--2,6-diaminopimelate ligase [Cytophagales bacterium]
MYLLSELLKGVTVKTLLGNKEARVKAITFDSRQVNTATLFVAIKGTNVDGHDFISQAIALGSNVVVVTHLPLQRAKEVTYVVVDHSARALGIIASNFYQTPSTKLQLIAVTGTNGKTSTVNLLYGLFKKLGYKVGMLSTLYNKVHEQTFPATHTTPDPLQINQLLAQMVKQGCQYCFMEASSHALEQERLAGLHLAGAVFLNITHDHLDYHQSFANYINAKKKLFDELPAQAFALFNADDKRKAVMVQNTKAAKHSFALKTPTAFTAKLLSNTLQGLELCIAGKSVWFQLIGAFNAYNLLAAYATACLLGKASDEVLIALSVLPPIRGRFQCIPTPQGFNTIVDYAHTPDALENVLTTIHQIKSKNSKIITVVGCGGDRDPHKRPLMAKIACQLSDKVVFTTDNPRSEAPKAIIKAMEAGLTDLQKRKTRAIVDRREAIKAACLLAETNDIVLIAGKGHETYQEIKGKKYPFDDVAVLKETVK